MATETLSQRVKLWVKHDPSPVARYLLRLWHATRQLNMPVVPFLHRALYYSHCHGKDAVIFLLSKLYWTPLFRSQLAGSSAGLRLSGAGMPLISGRLKIECGDACRLSVAITFSGRSAMHTPQLKIGNNVGIGWQSTLACGTRIELHDNVRIAQGCFLAGYPGHPLDPAKRAASLPDTDDQCGDIILERDVWLGSGVRVLPGVRIGRGSIIGTGSVVTQDIPANVLAAGSPARIIRHLESAV
ncbi:acyltransferase [Pseudobowmanella zhangzhouensis]|uniref:acyltransferase n=1 Tax=Pseudobowmanella zhangzhouensis TaxID=1537679 RepID=UPI003623F290